MPVTHEATRPKPARRAPIPETTLVKKPKMEDQIVLRRGLVGAVSRFIAFDLLAH
jgi:hypothetical protein